MERITLIRKIEFTNDEHEVLTIFFVQDKEIVIQSIHCDMKI